MRIIFVALALMLTTLAMGCDDDVAPNQTANDMSAAPDLSSAPDLANPHD
jgi:hypothetical protein